MDISNWLVKQESIVYMFCSVLWFVELESMLPSLKGTSDSLYMFFLEEQSLRCWPSSLLLPSATLLGPVSVQLSRSVVSNSLWPHGLQHSWPPCPSPTPGACSNSWPLSQWCHPIFSSSVIFFSSCLQSFSVLGSFQMSQFFASDAHQVLELQL